MNRTRTPKKQIFTARTTLFFAILLLIGGFIVYQFSQWQTMTIYQDKVDAVQRPMNKKITGYNKTFSAFKGDPESAVKLTPKFVQAAKETKRAANDIKAINAPDSADARHKLLIQLYEDSSSLYSDLAALSQYIVDRNKVIEKFAADTETFSKSIEAGQTDADVLAASQTMKAGADKAFADLGALKQPELEVYSNRALEDNLTAVSAALATMTDGLNSNDIAKVRQGAALLQTAFAKDWGQALFEGDTDGLKRFEVRTEGLKNLQTKLAS